MIITRTPYRISFFGGGTDHPVWYKQNGGAVLSASINKYCYINCRFLPPFFKYKHRIIYSEQEKVKHINEIDHPSVRESMRYAGIKQGIEIHHNGDLPAMSGLGSSSSFTVGLLHALYALNGKMTTKRQLALDAIHVEQNLIKENVGSQDQTIASFGGFNKIEFGGLSKISVTPITISTEKFNEFQNHLLLFFTDFSRKASEIEAKKLKNFKDRNSELQTMAAMVPEGVNILKDGNNLNDFGKLLDEGWKLKRSLAPVVSTNKIDNMYETGLRAGAIGGKLLGAGGGGFMLFFAPPERHKKIREKLKKFLYVPVNIEYQGSQIIYYAP
ncbi:MAG: kinase [Candidatus Yanofskybacteria bacterium RIFCSPHIGHO2_02_FULL_38_22b]|uniref:Kinase n=1 Tax=Candidatus Yanofskybacteria bacterium RIFCSPHIGHO2_02_FULL_38_22b TaxID=1802673 RepID=A0A1F8F2K5_9BACT|nr:MAG: kinase [Candidatus Yanofskybacteria bacterium RIFCSPHIGHO2_01_FULL_39_44]OGN06918.1 MAG: kinase [Candidatus Yanofskybacteria bacterium RIFCSPHIGHO2_02_FULL_38_22b]OGN20678.1 MAG: kinase [Candidatus Yanofskybacteria bacterium RIFCSPLOWO2_01_FULL_39_28]